MARLPDTSNPKAVSRFLQGLRGYDESEIDREITNIGEMEAVRPGTLMLDRDGYPLVKTHEGWYYLWSEAEGRYLEIALDEIDLFPVRVLP